MRLSLAKPWYVWRPGQIVRRLLAECRAESPGYQPLRTAWGAKVVADPCKSIGRSIRTTGVYDLAVSEALARLVEPGATAIDAGANIGYMTVLMSLAAGRTGRVHAFEPHPDLVGVLRRNAAAAAGLGGAAVEVHDCALGEEAGEALLELPREMALNDGVARISSGTSGAEAASVRVRVSTIDGQFPAATIDVLKLDVEGFELSVLRGAAAALAAGRVRHVIFEDHDSAHSPVVRHLESLGYTVYAIGWSLRGLRVAPLAGGRLAESYEAPSYLATREPDAAGRLAAAWGWRTLSPRFARRAPGRGKARAARPGIT